MAKKDEENPGGGRPGLPNTKEITKRNHHDKKPANGKPEGGQGGRRKEKLLSTPRRPKGKKKNLRGGKRN